MRRFLAFVLLIGLLASSNASESYELSENERRLAAELRFDLSLLEWIRSQGIGLKRLETYSWEENKMIPQNGVVLLTPKEKGSATLDKLRSRLKGATMSAYLYDNNYGYEPDEVAVFLSRDPYEYLEAVGVDAPNYDLSNEGIIKKFRAWDDRLGLELVGAGSDWLEARVLRPPEDWRKLATEVGRFAPDIIFQGAGSVEELAREMRKTKSIYLWWD